MKNKILSENDLCVALISPSRGTDSKKLVLAIKRLNEIGIKKIIYSDSLLDKKLGYWSGSAEQRAQDINDFFENPEVDVIWCLSGGISSLELIPKIDFKKIKENKKFFIGFSDVTSLQCAFLHYSNLETIQFYMPGISGWINNFNEIKLLKRIFELEDFSIFLKPGRIYKEGYAKGTLVGGCLELVANTLGTKHEIDTVGKILYLEDTGFKPHKLYHYLCLMHNTGKFDKIKGLILSKMHNCGNYLPYIELFLEKLSGQDIPIIVELDSGHHKRKVPILLGGKCEINTKENKIDFGFSDSAKKDFSKLYKKF